MIDQNASVDLNQTGSPPQNSYSSNISVGGEDISSVNSELPVPPEPAMVVSSGGTPKWFYFLFGIILIAFLVVTGFLVITLTKKQSPVVEISAPTPTEASASPTIEPSSIPVPTTVEIDPAVLKFDQQGSSDEVLEVETDIKNTDLSSIDESLSALDSQMDVPSGK